MPPQAYDLRMELLYHFGWLTLGLVLLYFGAEWLVKGAASLSLKVGLTPLVIGLTVVAFGTSAPELLVSLQSNLKDPPEGGLALGNVIGSNICNVALVLGVAAMIRPITIHRQLLSRELPILLIISLAFAWMLRDREIAFHEALILVITLVLFVVSSLRKGLNSNDDSEIEGMDEDEISAAKKASPAKVAIYLGLIILGFALLVFGADRLILSGIEIAERFGVPNALISLSFFALGTSIPELATSIVASQKRQGDIIMGNVVGSNLFNILAVVGITGLVGAIASDEIQSLDIWFMLGLTALCFPLVLRKRQLGRRSGLFLIILYFSYIIYSFLQR